MRSTTPTAAAARPTGARSRCRFFPPPTGAGRGCIAHGGSHWESFYTEDGEKLQKRFFGHFLKGEDPGWSTQPPVELKVRHPGEKFVMRHEKEWPLARTRWTKFYLDPAQMRLTRAEPDVSTSLPYETQGDGLLFEIELQAPMEITGPAAAKPW